MADCEPGESSGVNWKQRLVLLQYVRCMGRFDRLGTGLMLDGSLDAPHRCAVLPSVEMLPIDAVGIPVQLLSRPIAPQKHHPHFWSIPHTHSMRPAMWGFPPVLP
ncbi:unnamed protein product, partial [Discosporangium mesarthrocarpum]